MASNKAIAYTGEEDFRDETPAEELHTMLPLHDLIVVFEHEIREIIHYDSFEYEHGVSGIHIFRGTQKPHKCSYRIHATNLELGRITLTRKAPFKENEIGIIEKALGALTVHLNNAVEYQLSLSDEQRDDLKVDACVAGG